MADINIAAVYEHSSRSPEFLREIALKDIQDLCSPIEIQIVALIAEENVVFIVARHRSTMNLDTQPRGGLVNGLAADDHFP